MEPVMKPSLDGKLLDIEARFECGACGRQFKVHIDPGGRIPEGWDIYDAAVDAVRACGNSIQGDYILCRKCTGKCDNSDLIPAYRTGTRDEVRSVLGID
jgi:transcription elongation factor Elf1